MGTASFIVSSTSFVDGSDLDPKYATRAVKGGQNLSPALEWRGAPAGTKSFALGMIDPHPVARNWVHWLAVDIPATTTGLPEGASLKTMPNDARELENSSGEVGYSGPQPPVGSGKHPYEITIYALSTNHLAVDEALSLKEFQRALDGNVLASFKITVYFER
ncbi:YbhB/YbcL family Raf kinase inhibitor-like protein [Candidatus Peregrinibacteria bacterium]|nr:YbhB/YbcL family Raf kinase inhibitor-like protein [Candidatus Peregrinibacteria bacterium]